ncbi:unnamed protein product [Aphis gossypii]|uniref:Uncharacterized protein n=1 Tax=Aphis gossypii TaxID=80765 RepID=A0A9P0ILA1_APHGO|nr:unnamed protein product [Aphis gossypii]
MCTRSLIIINKRIYYIISEEGMTYVLSSRPFFALHKNRYRIIIIIIIIIINDGRTRLSNHLQLLSIRSWANSRRIAIRCVLRFDERLKRHVFCIIYTSSMANLRTATDSSGTNPVIAYGRADKKITVVDY